MDASSENRPVAPRDRPMDPAPPLWRLAPTRGDDGRCLADFMMLIPGLGGRHERVRALVAGRVREVCESYGGQVAFADINYSLNVLWVSVVAEPGLAGRVAQSIRGRVPEALLVGGQLGAVPAPPARPGRNALWTRLRRLSRRISARLEGPGCDRP